MALSRERVLQGAVEVADEGGIAGLTIRSLAQHLGVKPMSVYHHVANKEEILDGIVDMVFAEIALPKATGDWRAEMRERAESARQALRRHPWAIGLMETRTTPGPATMRHHDAVIGSLRAGGLPVRLTAHAYALLDSFIYGFALQEATLPIDGPADELVGEMLRRGSYPHFEEMAREVVLQPGYDFGAEFDFGLSTILDALQARLELES